MPINKCYTTFKLTYTVYLLYLKMADTTFDYVQQCSNRQEWTGKLIFLSVTAFGFFSDEGSRN